MEIAVVFLPLLGAALAGFGRKLLGPRGAEIVTTSLLIIAAALGAQIFYDYALLGQIRVIPLLNWLNSGLLNVSWALRFDVLTAVMVLVVTSVSACVHLYSIGYMHEDPSRAKFMAYLSLFTFMMLMLVTADNLLQMFFGWEGVGLASYLLIGFWNQKPSANDASIKAFVVNRVGDWGFILGIILVFILSGSLNFTDIFASVPALANKTFRLFGHNFGALNLAVILLFIGAVGKSAQLGLHTWLPDAMEGPTPVSALIHAATMVTAGVFMLVRMSPLLAAAPFAREIIVIVGALTAFVGATIAFTQFDIKKMIAYSTMSQLGYMVFAAGLGGYGAAIFHLFTHAFFKALLFLGAGAVIHAMHHEQDLRKMGGLWKKMPLTYALMWIGTLALAGFPLLAGYYSKDMILEVAFMSPAATHMIAYILGVIVALGTAIYGSKVVLMAFHGPAHWDHKDDPHHQEPVAADDHHHHGDQAHHHLPIPVPLVMLIPLCILAIGAIFSGGVFYDYFVGEQYPAFWQSAVPDAIHGAIEHAHHAPFLAKIIPTIAALSGLVLGVVFYWWKPYLPSKIATSLGELNRIVANKWYFDWLYSRIFVRPAAFLGRILFRYGDQGGIDRFGVDATGFGSKSLGARLSALHTGFVYHYAFVMLIGLVLLLGWFLWHSNV